MKLDRDFAREVKKQANGEGSREDRFRFLRTARAACAELSTTRARTVFPDVLRKYGRAAVAVCVAATVVAREDRLEPSTVRWGREVLTLWTNRPATLATVRIEDNLHPSRIEEYAGEFIRLTTEEQ